jgi:hypothetical protein
MKKTIYLFVFIILTISLIGCDSSIDSQQAISTGANNVETETKEDGITDTIVSGGDNDEASNNSDVSASSAEVESVLAGEITLNNESVKITEAGTYTMSGSLDNGQIIIDAGDSDEVEIILKDVQINSNYSSPIYVINADKVRISSQGDTNVLSIGADISDNADSIDGVIYSKSDLVFEGTGTLSINSDYTHGIVGKDDIDFVSGNYKINVSQDGIQANDSVSVLDTNLSIIAEKDGIQVENDENTDKGYVYFENSKLSLESGQDAVNATNYINIVSGQYTIDAGEDGLQADIYLNILDGTFDIRSGGGYQGVLNIITVGEGSGGSVSETDKLTESMKALKSNDIILEEGSFLISSYEDGINANNDIVINGGNYNINSGDEAITAHNSLEINGGTLIIENGYEGLEGSYITINGGDISINVLDDGINGGETYSLVTIAGGNLSVTCQGDGLDSNGDMVISGGYIILDVSAIYAGGDGNVDVTGSLTYTGGTIVDEKGVNIDPTQAVKGGRTQGGPGTPGVPGGRR